MTENHPANKTDHDTADNARQSTVTGLIFIFAGFILLANTLGLLAWGIWDVIFQFWPVLLILWGSDLLLGNSRRGRILSGVVTFAILLAVAAFALASVSPAFGRWLRQRVRLPGTPASPRRLYLSPPGRGMGL